MSHRMTQINELLKNELGQLLMTNVDFPKGCLVTIVGVEASKDLRHARVFISIMPIVMTQKVMDILRREIGALQFELNKRLTMKPLPRIKFVVDDTERRAADIDELLNRIAKEENLDE